MNESTAAYYSSVHCHKKTLTPSTVCIAMHWHVEFPSFPLLYSCRESTGSWSSIVSTASQSARTRRGRPQTTEDDDITNGVRSSIATCDGKTAGTMINCAGC